MRKLTLSLAAAAGAIIAASPAAAQWAPPPQPGYGAPYGNAYGYDNRGQVRALQVRAQQLRDRVHQLHARNRLSNREAQRLDRQAVGLQRRIRAAASQGLSWRERQDLERRLNALREAIRHETRDGRRGQWRDRDDHRGNRDDDRRFDRDDDDDDDDRRGRRGNRDDD